MASKNNSKIISDLHPHTLKKFEIIETYIKSWAQKLMLTDGCSGIVFIDCMCNSGVYHDNGRIVYGTPIRVANVLLDVARSYTGKQVHIFFNDNDSRKIDELRKHLPPDERNYSIITTVQDGNELLKWIGPQLFQNSSHMNFFLLYDPYDASIDWDALLPFFRNWGEVLINHMVSDSIRAISQVKKEDKIRKYENTYQVNDISELIPYGSDKSAYEKRIIEIIEKMSS